jgi:hypothetical protein
MTMTIALVFLIAALLPAPTPVHEFHVTYGRLAVEGQVAVGRIRFFREDLELTLAAFSRREAVRMEATAAVDSLFLAYFREHFRLEVDGRVLEGRILSSGDDELDREPAWWYLIRFDADTVIDDFRVRNTLLFDQYDDQKNILNVVRFPEETQRAYHFSMGEEVFEVHF